MKYIFLVSIIIGVINVVLSETTNETMAWICSSLFAITSLLFLLERNKSKKDSDEGC
jgi:hypothetical protein